jgi:holo-[acyl-carrier protein] synthase
VGQGAFGEGVILRGLGVDLCAVDRIENLMQKHGSRLKGRVFEHREWEESAGRPESLAARWAAKEAFGKALGTGLRGFSWSEVAVHRDSSGAPRLFFSGAAAEKISGLGGGEFQLSFSHEGNMAVALVVWMQTQAKG